jgi:hypothetical protein
MLARSRHQEETRITFAYTTLLNREAAVIETQQSPRLGKGLICRCRNTFQVRHDNCQAWPTASGKELQCVVPISDPESLDSCAVTISAA